MALSLSSTAVDKKLTPSKLALGFLGAAMTTLIGFAGIANAAPADKPTKEWCEQHGFKNYGQCIKQWAHNRGGGYGSQNVAISTGIDLDVSGNNNVINIIIKYVFGG